MGRLTNCEAALEFEEKCHYCKSKARYTDIAQIGQDSYAMVGICRCHLSMEASS